MGRTIKTFFLRQFPERCNCSSCTSHSVFLAMPHLPTPPPCPAAINQKQPFYGDSVYVAKTAPPGEKWLRLLGDFNARFDDTFNTGQGSWNLAAQVKKKKRKNTNGLFLLSLCAENDPTALSNALFRQADN